MTASEKQEALEAKYSRHCQVQGKCEACNGGPFDVHIMQMAHIIGQTKVNLKKYGAEIIHHPMNMKLTCCLACNASVQINPATRRLEAEEHVEKIRQAIQSERNRNG